MKAVRIIQFILLVLVAVYLFLIHSVNNPIGLPYLIPLSPAIAIAFAFVLGWLIGLLPGQTASWRKNRQIRKLEKKIAELEKNTSSYSSKSTVIPDRTPAEEEMGI